MKDFKKMSDVELEAECDRLRKLTGDMSSLIFDECRVRGDMYRAQNAGNVNWELKCRNLLKDIHAGLAERARLGAEHRQARAELDRRTSPLEPGFRGPQISDAEAGL